VNSSFAINLRKCGAALLIVLAFVVLLSGIVVAYLSRTTGDRQLAHGTFSENRADILARSALDLIVGDLKQEIANGSSVSTDSNGKNSIYSPTTAANILPRRSGTPTPVSSPDPMPNLVRRSVYNDGIASPPGVPSRASNLNSTTAASLNGRSVALAQWNKHYLIPRYNTGTTIDCTPPSPLTSPYNPNPPVSTGFTPPDWVFVTTAGPTVIAAPTSTVVGRYAYAIYDEGGLLDINVAGFPSNTTAAQIGRKGSLVSADLTQLASLPQSPQIDRIVGWRNSASAQATPSPTPNAFPLWNFDAASTSRYFTVVLSNARGNGFLTANATSWNGLTDQAFLTRQELLQFRSDTGFSQNALQYLTTFSRELNRPNWTPALNAADMGAPTNGPQNIYAYRDNANASVTPTPTPINKNLATLRLASTFLLPTPTPSPRADGTAFNPGEPLIKERFPLSRIAGLGWNGPLTTGNSTLINGVLSPATATTIQRDFGLFWNTSVPSNPHWDYVGASPTNTIQPRILRLDEVAQGKVLDASGNYVAATTIYREPNFFEVLKAVILNGSLGLGTNGPTFVAAESKYWDTTNGLSADYQIMQIGANIIDAWDADNVPTFINFAGNQLAGVENLPYLNKLVFTPYLPSPGSGFCDAWLVPSLWNPHQNATSATGTIRVKLTSTAVPGLTASLTNNSTPAQTATSLPMGGLPAWMDINLAMPSPAPSYPYCFAIPQPQKSILSPGPTPPVTSTKTPPDIASIESYYGFHFTFDTTPGGPASQIDTSNVATGWPDFGTASSATSIELDVQLPGTSTFVPYQTWKIAAVNHPLILQIPSGANHSLYFTGSSHMLQDPEFVALDPRTVRFGIWGTAAIGQTSGSNYTKDYVQGLQDSIDEQSPASRIEQITYYTPQGSSFKPVVAGPTPAPANLYLYSSNIGTGSTARYTDPDGVQRRGDWTTDANGTVKGTTIMYAGPTPPPGPTPANAQDRPQILSAPFQSVAELGQVFRDQPWKTLNFTAVTSGDIGLLDAFTLQDTPAVAGRTSLNTRQSAVLTAILSQATKNLTGTTLISSTDRNTIVTRLIALTAAYPMLNKTELITRLMADPTVALLLNPASGPVWNKEAREAIVRALSDSGQTRTWNLMIDVVAQSGKYPPTVTANPVAADLPKFIVEGEKRYWLHVAIDRFTGEVIDQQLEAVYE